MNFHEQQQKKLEYQYRKLERGIRIMAKQKFLRSFSPLAAHRKVEQIRQVYIQLGRKPSSPRWPL